MATVHKLDKFLSDVNVEGLNSFLVDSEKVSKKEFNAFVQKVIEFINQTKDITETEIEAIRRAIEQLRAEIRDENTNALGEMSSKVDHVFVGDRIADIEKRIEEYKNNSSLSIEEAKKSASKMVDQKLKDVDYRMSSVKDGKSLTWADLTEDQREALRGRPGFDHTDAIKGLQKEVLELKKYLEGSIKGSVGGGVTNMRITQAFKSILRTETPVGALNGSNTTYTVTQPIFAILEFALNGEVIHPGNYSYANRTITFSSALPAAYSGKDFTVKYL